ncbi:CHAD domain-containing protein [Mucilaginibacter sp. UR6-11]|uniref:CHAD domain-containing protein n=1 Tax=Mucilaginibacter sp. UR6-11 TaxID=1435644 RepID=UPI001E5063EA|nr:CHAD domain-containing protein [Mucilaginibacter sp. UR6-11]MCC8426414.1 CHAD domain-containing protein [Mucilaginibacter sp. UR6-11]
MKKKKARKYLKKEWKVMERYLKTYLKKKNQEDLHQFRVQVKKLQAFFTLSDHSSDAELTPAFKPVKKVFKQAGEVRNAYISGKLTQRRRSADEAARNFRKHAEEYQESIVKVRRMLKNKLRPMNNKTLQQFYENQLHQIAAGLAKQPSAGQLHECRKRIKVLLYNYPLIHDKLLFSLDTAYLDHLQEAIGNWHDHWLAGTLTANTIRVTNELTRNFYERALGQPDQDHALS